VQRVLDVAYNLTHQLTLHKKETSVMNEDASSALATLEALEADSSRLAKEAILAGVSENELLKRVFQITGDPYTDYGVRKFNVPQPAGTDDLSLERFVYKTLPMLANRTLSGNAARDEVEKAFSTMSALQQKWCHRILLKNLRCGVSEKTVNKVWPGLISRFEVMLADKVDVDEKNVPVNVTFPVRVEPKLDGLRLVSVKMNGYVVLYTRNGNVVDTLPSIKNAIESHPRDNFVLDGECLGADWNESNSVMMSTKRSKDDVGMVFNVFDTLTTEEWFSMTTNKSLTDRQRDLECIIGEFHNDAPVKHVEGIVASCMDDVMAFYSECLASGYEGVMLKEQTAPYEFKRSSGVKKFKPIQTFEGVVSGWYKGTVGRKREGLFAGFYVLLPNGVITRVGNGFSDLLKKEINDVGPDTYNGKVVEVEGQPDMATRDGLSKDGRVRFPVFTRFRDPRDVDPKVIEAYSVFTKKDDK
jgi:DNA ligase-1